METVDFKDKLEETKGQINNSIKDLTDGKYLSLSCSKSLPAFPRIFLLSRTSNTWRIPARFLVQKLNSRPSSHSNNLAFWAFLPSSFHLAEIPGVSVLFSVLALLSDELPHALLAVPLTKYGLGQVTNPVFQPGNEGFG